MPDTRPHKAHGPLPPQPAPADTPLYEISVEHSRQLDRRAVTDYAIASIILMENAAIGLAAHALEMLGPARTRHTVILAGPGNNAGDAFACARHLHNHRAPLTIVIIHDPDLYTGDAKTNLGIITRMGLPIISAAAFLADPPPRSPALIIDALFGTGLSRPIQGPGADLIDWSNRARRAKPTPARVLAADIPSGLDATTGKPLGGAVITADRTVAFAALKPAMSAVEAQPYLGETHTAPIGVPIELLEELATRVTRPADPTRQ